MPREVEDPAWALVQKELAEALAPFAPLFGGRRCVHEDDWADCEHEGCGFGDSEPRPGSMPVVQHFLLLVSTTDMAQDSDHQSVIVAIDGHGQPGYIGRGMANDFLS